MARFRCECSGPCCLKWLKTNLLLILTFLALCAGIGIGVGLRYRNPKLTKEEMDLLDFPGILLLRMLKMLILPLIISSLISAVATVDSKVSGAMGWKACVYYLTTTITAVILGLVLVLTIRPGKRGSASIKKSGNPTVVRPYDPILDLIRNLFPENLVSACFEKAKTRGVLKPGVPVPNPNLTGLNEIGINFTDYTFTTVTTGGMNVLGILAFSLVFGVFIGRMGEPTRILVSFFEAMNLAIMKLIGLFIWYSPIGIMFLVAGKIVEMKDPMETLTQLGFYTITVLAGLAIHGFIILPLIYVIFVRKNPITYFTGVLPALLTALATASSSATLPVTTRCLEEKIGIDRRVTRFVLPIGATINMDGTALYEAVAVNFIAQVGGRTLDVGEVIVVSILATVASIGAAGIPQAGMVTMIMVLVAVGIPVDDIRIILAIDWFLDRCRTTVNVWGDSIGAAVVEKYSKAQFAKADAEVPAQPIEFDDLNSDRKVGTDNENFQGSDTDLKVSNGQ